MVKERVKTTGFRRGKNKIIIKAISLIIVQIFFITSLGYSGPSSDANLRVPMGFGKKNPYDSVSRRAQRLTKSYGRGPFLRDFNSIDAKYFDWHRDSVVAAEASQYLGKKGSNRLRRLNEALDILKTVPSGKDKLFSFRELKEATQNGFQLYKGNLLGAANHDNIPGLNLALFYSKSSMDISAYTRAFFIAHEFSHALGRDEQESYEIMVKFLVRYGNDVASLIRGDVDKEMRGVGGPRANNLILELIDAVLTELTDTSDETMIIKAVQLQISVLVEKSEQLSADLDDKHRYVATQVKTTKGKQRLLEFSKLCKTNYYANESKTYQEDSALIQGTVMAMLREGLSGIVELKEVMNTPRIAEQLTRIINIGISSYARGIEDITLDSQLLAFFQILQISDTLTADTRGRVLKKVKKYIKSCPQEKLFLLLYEDMLEDIKIVTIEILSGILKKLRLLDLLVLYQEHIGMTQRTLLIAVMESYDFQGESLDFLSICLANPALQNPELKRIRDNVAQQIETIKSQEPEERKIEIAHSEERAPLDNLTLLAGLRALKDPKLSAYAGEALNAKVADLKSSADIGQLSEQLTQVSATETDIKEELMKCLIEKINALRAVWEFSQWFEDQRVQGEVRAFLADQALGKKLKNADIDGFSKYLEDPRIGPSLRAHLEDKAKVLIDRAFPYLKAATIALRNTQYQGHIRKLILAHGYELMPAKDEFLKLAARLQDREIVPALDSEEEIAVRIRDMVTDIIRGANLLQICQWMSDGNMKHYTRMKYLLDKELGARAVKINTYAEWVNIFKFIKQGYIRNPAAYVFRKLFYSRIKELTPEEAVRYFESQELSEEDAIKRKLSAAAENASPMVTSQELRWQDFSQDKFGPLIKKRGGNAIQVNQERTREGVAQYRIKLQKGDELMCPVQGASVIETTESALVMNCGGVCRLSVMGFASLISNAPGRVLAKGETIGRIEKDAEIVVIFWTLPQVDKEHSVAGMERWIRAVLSDGSEALYGEREQTSLKPASAPKLAERMEEIAGRQPVDGDPAMQARDATNQGPALGSGISLSPAARLEESLRLFNMAVEHNNWGQALEKAFQALNIEGLEQADHARCVNAIGARVVPEITRLARTTSYGYYMPAYLFLDRLGISASKAMWPKIILALESAEKVYRFRMMNVDMILPITNEIMTNASSLISIWRSESRAEPEGFQEVCARYNNMLTRKNLHPIKGAYFLYVFVVWQRAIKIWFNESAPSDWQSFVDGVGEALKKSLEEVRLTGQMASLPEEVIEAMQRKPAGAIKFVAEDSQVGTLYAAKAEPVEPEQPMERPLHTDRIFNDRLRALAVLINRIDRALDENGPDAQALASLGLNTRDFADQFTFNRREVGWFSGSYITSGPFFIGPIQIETLFSVLHMAWLDAMENINQDVARANYIDDAADMLWRLGWVFDADSVKRHSQMVQLISSINKSEEIRWFKDSIYYMDAKLIMELRRLTPFKAAHYKRIAGLINRGDLYLKECEEYALGLQARGSLALKDFEFIVYATMAHQSTVSMLDVNGAYVKNLNRERNIQAITEAGKISSRAIELNGKTRQSNIVEAWLAGNAGEQFRATGGNTANNPGDFLLEDIRSIWTDHLLRELQGANSFKIEEKVYFRRLIFVNPEDKSKLLIGELAIVGDTAYLEPFFSGIAQADIILAALANNQIVVKEVVILPAVYSFIRENTYVNISI